ncbi:hypothetical protein [Pseudorhodoferax sp. Leaf274]|uniref:hypothetical protein n=1 Tax=Pseudorhodoferax sp. Leaf274 TaxID=1736318 RepID=UPI0012E2CBC6|nr:hypothetical protein [Pseudorhodoferax sp. Leaf274]
MCSEPDLWLRTPAQLERAARQQLRHQQGDAPPWLVPILFVPGIGGSRLALVDARNAPANGNHDTFLWDPDSSSQHRRAYGWLAQSEADLSANDAAALALARRWQAQAQVMRHRAEDTDDSLVRLLADSQGLPNACALLPELHHALLAQARGLESRGWMALPRAYMPLAQQLSDTLGTATDPQFAFLAHAHAWDWRQHPADAASGLLNAIQALLSQPHVHPMERAWRWPGQPGLVIVAENAGMELVRAALPLCPAGSVMAVYAVDDVRPQTLPDDRSHGASASRAWFAALCNARNSGGSDASGQDTRVLSAGWSAWQATFKDSRAARLAVNAVLAGPLSLLPAMASEFGFGTGTPRAVLDDPLCLLRTRIGWDGHGPMPPLLEADPSWHARAQAVAQDVQRRAAAQTTQAVSQVNCVADTRLPTTVHLQWNKYPASIGQDSADSLHRWRLDVEADGGVWHASSDDGFPTLRCSSAAQLSSQIRRDICQRLLRQAPTPMGQVLQPWFAERVCKAGRPHVNGVPS